MEAGARSFLHFLLLVVVGGGGVAVVITDLEERKHVAECRVLLGT